jgi:hypothetical protein
MRTHRRMEETMKDGQIEGERERERHTQRERETQRERDTHHKEREM